MVPGPEAEKRRLTVGRWRKWTTVCIPARAENEGWLQPQKQWIRPAALAQQRQVPAQCPGLWQQRLKPLSEFPAIELDTSGARQVGRVGHPAAEIAQLLKKAECFHLEKCLSDQALLCAELQTLLSQVVHPGAVQEGWDAACSISTGRKHVCPSAEHRHGYKHKPFTYYSFLPWEGVHFSGLPKSTSADSSWMLPSETFLPSLEGCPHSHAQGPYINLLKLQKCKTECPSLLKWWHHGTSSLWLKKTPIKNLP